MDEEKTPNVLLFLFIGIVIVGCVAFGRYVFPKMPANTFVSNYPDQQRSIENCDLKGCELLCFDYYGSWGKTFAECTDACVEAYNIFCPK